MTEIRTKFLFRLALDVGAHHVVGATPFGSRRVAPIKGGTFEGPQLSGIVLPAAPTGSRRMLPAPGLVSMCACRYAPMTATC